MIETILTYIVLAYSAITFVFSLKIVQYIIVFFGIIWIAHCIQGLWNELINAIKNRE